MKRIVVCMDGTWQTLRQDRPTNIALIARSVAHKQTIEGAGGQPDQHIHQIVIYTQGVGSAVDALPGRGLFAKFMADTKRFLGGAFGDGLEDGILDAYLRLCFNYEEGDEIYIFGFSRGAFAARRLAGLINTSGILSRRYVHKAWDAYTLYHNAPRSTASEEKLADHEQAALQFRSLYGKGGRNPDGTRTQKGEPPTIAFLGVFDTVVQRGLGRVLASSTPWGRRRFEFKNLQVCPNVLAARHAVAVDERRWTFTPTLWTQLDESNQAMRARAGAGPERTFFQQRWFVGTHGDVGGGENSKLSALTLKWMTEGAAEFGLRFYGAYGGDRSPAEEYIKAAGLAYDAPITYPTWWKRIFYPIHYSVNYRRIWAEKRKKPEAAHLDYYFDRSVLMRASAGHLRPRYKPGSLRPFRKLVQDWAKLNPLD
ncbi:MAG TPA: DUF2235 domain-containing protein [Terricaulis sp.]|nr:DUF2235 domain-containing protein [Terricaulis sp.]